LKCRGQAINEIAKESEMLLNKMSRIVTLGTLVLYFHAGFAMDASSSTSARQLDQAIFDATFQTVTNVDETGAKSAIQLNADEQANLVQTIADNGKADQFGRDSIADESVPSDVIAPADTDCCYAVNIWASPQTVYVPAGTLGSTNIHWWWNTINGFSGAQYGCLYVKNNSTGLWSVVQCEHKGNNYTTYIPWIQGGVNAVFRVAVQQDTATHNPPVFIAGTLSGGNNIVTVVGIKN
jgi:hypothetical protein